jgi:hypothetical protein
MTFDEILRSELIKINGINNKVYPLVAPKNEDAPFVVYKKGLTLFSKTHDGIELKHDSTYNIVVIEKTYSNLQALELSVINKLIEMLEVHVKGLTVSVTGNDYVEEIDWYRSDIELKVKY